MFALTFIHFVATEMRSTIMTLLAIHELVTSWMYTQYFAVDNINLDNIYPDGCTPSVIDEQCRDCFEAALWSFDPSFTCRNRHCVSHMGYPLGDNSWTYAWYILLLESLAVIGYGLARLFQEAWKCGFARFGWNSGEYFVFTQNLEREKCFRGLLTIQFTSCILGFIWGVCIDIMLGTLAEGVFGNQLVIIFFFMEMSKEMRALGDRNWELFKGLNKAAFVGVDFVRGLHLFLYSSNDHFFGDLVRGANLANRAGGESDKLERILGPDAQELKHTLLTADIQESVELGIRSVDRRSLSTTRSWATAERHAV